MKQKRNANETGADRELNRNETEMGNEMERDGNGRGTEKGLNKKTATDKEQGKR